jgi:hypothetical protein
MPYTFRPHDIVQVLRESGDWEEWAIIRNEIDAASAVALVDKTGEHANNTAAFRITRYQIGSGHAPVYPVPPVITDTDSSLIADALRHAAARYDECQALATVSFSGLAEQFANQARRARELADIFSNYPHVTISLTP